MKPLLILLLLGCGQLRSQVKHKAKPALTDSSFVFTSHITYCPCYDTVKATAVFFPGDSGKVITKEVYAITVWPDKSNNPVVGWLDVDRSTRLYFEKVWYTEIKNSK